MTRKLHHWSHEYNVITIFQKLLLWVYAHCFASFHLMPIVHQYNGLQLMFLFLSMANEKKLIDISEPAMWHEYWSEEFPVQQLSL